MKKTSMKLKRNKLRNAIVLSIVVGSASAGMAQAQDAQSNTSGDQSRLDTIVVTGTRIKSQTMTSSSPVTEIDGEAFKRTGALGVEDLVNQYPQLDLQFDNFENNPSTGYATISLRQLGSARTLTLVNGRRLPMGRYESIDVSVIPTALVRRVDVLTGGASAVYGADAVAGVVNFILDDEFEGANINFGYTGYQHVNDNETIQGYTDARGFYTPKGNTGLDGTSQTFDMVLGGKFGDNGHVVGYLNYRKTDALMQDARDYSACSVAGVGSTAAQHSCGGSGTADPANFLVYSPDFEEGNQLVYTGNNTFTPGANIFNYAPDNYFQRPDRRYSAGFMAKYEVNEHFTPYAEAIFVDRKSSMQIAASGMFANTGFELPCDSEFLGNACDAAGLTAAGYDQALVYILKRNVEGGPRHHDTTTTTYRITVGAKGAIGGSWTYDAALLYGSTRALDVGRNDFLISKINSAIMGCDPNSPYGTFDGCIPYDVWHNNVSSESADAVAGTSFENVSTQLRALSFNVAGGLGFAFPWANSEEAQLALGVEHRTTTYNTAYDSDSVAGNFTGAGSASLLVNAADSVTDYYGELGVPFFVNEDGAFNRLDGTFGYRHSVYDLSGGADTWKAGLSASFLDNKLLVRSGYNRAIRTPGLNDLFYPQSVALDGSTDYCAGPNPEATAEQCARTGVTAGQYGRIPINPASQYYGLIGGAPNLKPEVADTYTFGVAFEPIRGLNLAVDWYRIKIKDGISSIGYEATQTLCMEQGLYCDLIHRNPVTGDLWLGASTSPTVGYIEDVAQNVGFSQRDGLDFNLGYGFNLGAGRMTTSFVGTYMLKNWDQPLAAVDSTGYECKGKINTLCSLPANKWRHIASVNYAFDRYSFGLRWRYLSKLSYEDAYDGHELTSNQWVAANGGIGAYNYIDLNASVNLGPARWSIGVNNVADREPPFTGGSGGLNSGTSNSANGYDQLGRFWFTNLSFSF